MDLPRPPSRTKRIKPFAIGAGVLVAVTVSIALARMEPAVPSIARDRIIVDTVVRGDLIQEVRGSGKLLPEQQLQIPATTSGRVEEVRVEQGESVRAGDILLLLSNPEVDLQVLQAERALAEARTTRQQLVADREIEVLAARRELVTLRTRLREAERRNDAVANLVADGLVPRSEASSTEDLWRELIELVRLAEEQMAVADSTFEDGLRAQDEEARRVEEMAIFHRDRVASLAVRSGAAGVVQALPVEQGQWVVSGELLARVFRPGDLKAELRVPEARSGEIAPEQSAVLTIRGESIRGVVRRVSPVAVGGAVAVDIRLTSELPASARPDLNIEGRIETGRVANSLHLRRPAHAASGRRAAMYRMDGDRAAELVSLLFGAQSAERIVVEEGAASGDVIIVSDLSETLGAPRIRIRN